jgi:hypothetical protein
MHTTSYIGLLLVSIDESTRMKMCLRTLPALLFLCTLGCVTPVTPEQIAGADYGEVPVAPAYQRAIQRYMLGVLWEPLTAHYRFLEEPRKGYVYLSGRMKPHVFGYLVHVGITAKNMKGSYAGEKPYRFFLKNELIYLLNESDKADVVH